MKLRLLTPLLLFLLLANLPFWLACHFFGLLSKGAFDVEFLLVGIVSLFVSRRIAVLLLALAIALDLLSGIAVTYLFTASETVQSVRWLSEVVPQHAMGTVVVVLSAVLALLLVAYAPPLPAKWKLSVSAALVVLFIACAALDLATGKAPSFWHTERQLGTVRLSRTPLASLLGMNAQQARVASLSRGVTFVASGTPSASQAALLPALLPSSAAPPPNIVLVLAESWGHPLNRDLDQALAQPFENPALIERYIVRKGTVPFHGATLDAEVRELCGGSRGFSLIDASASELAGCLPARLRARGYRTVGIHGYTGRMYSRRAWWKTIGFDELWFREQLEPQHLPSCPGAFPGICDAAIASWLGDKLDQPSPTPSFLYWVTLNSHLPIPLPNSVAHPASCSTLAATAQSDVLCSWFQLIVDTERSVTTLALRPSGRPSAFLIVGDHQPPFSTPALRSQFSDRVVPYVLLLPRPDSMPNPASLPDTVLADHRSRHATRKTHIQISKTAHTGD